MKKLYMLNALWYKPEGGAAKHQEYLKAVLPNAVKYGGSVTDYYHPDESLIGEFDADLVFSSNGPTQKPSRIFGPIQNTNKRGFCARPRSGIHY